MQAFARAVDAVDDAGVHAVGVELKADDRSGTDPTAAAVRAAGRIEPQLNAGEGRRVHLVFANAKHSALRFQVSVERHAVESANSDTAQ